MGFLIVVRLAPRTTGRNGEEKDVEEEEEEEEDK